jgi:hypothetical protein
MKGSYNVVSTRVFFDEIERIEIDTHPQTRVINLGALCIYAKDDAENPALIFADIQNPEGMLELVNRIEMTTPDPIPWAHVEKTRVVLY